MRWTWRAPIFKGNQPACKSGQAVAADDDWDNVPFPAKHSDKCERAYDEDKPIDVSVTRENDVQSKPESQVQNHPRLRP